MKKTHIPTVAAVLVAGIAAWWTIDSPPRTDGTDAGPKATGSSAGGGVVDFGDSVERSATKSDRRQVAERSPAEVLMAAVERRALSSKAVEHGFIERLGKAGRGGQVSFELPDGRQAVGVIERIEFDDAGRVVDVEGVLEKPAAGRFLTAMSAAPRP